MYRDLINQRFGKLVVIGQASTYITPSNNQKTNRRWTVKCDCGTISIMKGSQLTSKRRNSTTCGCSRLSTFDSEEQKLEYFLNHVRRTYAQNAKVRNKEFLLTNDQIKSIIFKNCTYCGIKGFPYKGSYGRKFGDYYTKINGIDRQDNSLGYEFTNCVPCCKFCNRIKREATNVDFNKWLEHLKGGL